MNNLIINYQTEAICDDCGENIEEAYYTNTKNKIVHITTITNGHYYLDGSVNCDACHEANR